MTSAATSRVVLKSAREIELMRAAGLLVRSILDAIEKIARPGATTNEMNAVADRMIREAGATALFLGVEHPSAKNPFPASICASLNEEVVHGIPNDRPLVEGDIVSIDCGVRLKGYCGDHARTFAIGEVSPEANRLLEVTSGALDLAIREMRPGLAWSKVARRMQTYVQDAGFGVVRNYVGHGIGREMHEEPKVPNYVDPDGDFRLTPGLVVAIEPMVTAGSAATRQVGRDGWAVVTRDGSLAAHFEHTVAVTDKGVRVLTGASDKAAARDGENES
ncbi:MAG: type I methionyl aminopeptidase [Phycisphaerales bacterium]|nr:type I methionyl aminopeptidase [Phycisphaerales bacterium]